MKKVILASIFIAFVFFAFAQSQTELNEMAYAEYNKADAELNTVYQRIRTKYGSDQKTLTGLRDAKR
jgi:uncharacterized protein YecT (DUF1311 family)